MPTVVVIDSDIPGTTLIEQTEDDGITVSRSWWHEEIPVAARLNPDAPPATDMRSGASGETIEWAMPSAETWRLMDGDGDGKAEERRQAFRDAMIAAGRDVSREV